MFVRNLRLIISKQNPVTSPDATFVQLLLEHQNMVRKICRAYCPLEEDQRDLFQEIALQLWRAYPNFRNEAKASTWIYRISLNVAISGLRKARPKLAQLTGVLNQIPDSEPNMEGQLGMLYQAMYALTDEEKALLLLYFEEKSTEEIAELTGLNPNNIRVKMHRIREKLKNQLITASNPS